VQIGKQIQIRIKLAAVQLLEVTTPTRCGKCTIKIRIVIAKCLVI